MLHFRAERSNPMSSAPQIAGLFACLIAASIWGSATASPLRVDEKIRNALQLDQNAVRGEKIYSKNCGQCHGPQALGRAENAIPALAGQRRAYLIKQLADFSELERDSRDMHKVVSKPEVAEPQAWADAAGYLNRLQPAQFPQTGDSRSVELGEAIFQEQCASCHAQDARGDDDGFVPSLRDQHHAYLVRQMRAMGSWHRSNVDEDLVRFLDSFDAEEVAAVADYLSRLRGPSRDRTKLNDDGTVND
jgi:cytochrome c553